MVMSLPFLKRIALTVNTVIFLLVFVHLAFFKSVNVPFLVAFSIPDACIYLIGYFLILRDKLDIYTWLLFIWITIYTGVTTLCIGNGYGFHLYCFSIIPIVFITEYIGYKRKKRKMIALPLSIAITLFYIIFTGYVTKHGPIYDRGEEKLTMFWSFNALVVFSFLICFIYYLIKLIVISEDKLREAAQIDQLTRLYNRHYMFDKLSDITDRDRECILAIVDIDNFKKVNDIYGHNAGDEVLKNISGHLRKECRGCEISRWGGEEFLVVSYSPYADTVAMLEKLRKNIETTPVEHDGKKIQTTVTAGVASRSSGQDLNELIQTADKRLYHGKNNGKNCIVTGAEV